MGKIIKELNSLNIKLNITAVYNSNQTKKILKSINKKTKVIISFLLVEQETQVKIQFQSLKKVLYWQKNLRMLKIFLVSVREPYNYIQAKQLGCHIITHTPKTIQQIENFGKSFNQLTKETVKTFLVDSEKSKFKI